MYVRFGNLTVEQFALRVEAEFTVDEMVLLKAHRTNDANFTDPAKFHIFADPLCIVVGSEAFAATREVWTRADARKSFNQLVSFFPIAENVEVSA